MEDFSSECGAREALMVDNKEECKAPAFKFPILRTSSLPWDEYNYSGSKHMVAGENFVVEIQSSIDKLKRLRVVVVAVRAAFRFQLGRHLPRIAAIADDDHIHQIQGIVRRRDLEKLAQFGGISGLAKLLQTSLQTGIDTRDDEEDEEFARRRRAFGENAYPRRQSKTLWHFLYESSKDITLNILMLCAILSLAFGIKSEGLQQGWYDGVSISFAVVLVVIVTAISDFRQSRQFQSLDKEKDNIQVQVVRAGRRKGISIFDIVVGDLVELRIGDQVPADGLFLKGQCLAIDESSMTGESEPLLPDQDKHPFLWSGCKVQEGYGFMLVTAVGTSTEWGQTMATISSDNAEETPLQVRLKRVAILIGKVGLSVALLVLTILSIFYFSGHSGSGSSGTRFRAHETSASQVLNSLVDIFSIAVTIVVVAVPEGLPLAVTLSLAYSMRRMMADKALVRRLSACEIMGSATTICSDKTGTLTTNKMTVVKTWIAGKMIESEAAGRDTVINSTLELLFQAIAQNTTGSVFVPVPKGGADDSLEAVEVSGSPTEKALLWWGLKLGMKFEETRCESTVLKVETFSSVKKRAGVALKMPRDGRVFMHWKGAAEIILAACHKWQTERDIAIDMSMEMRREVNNMIEGMASASLRCIAFAYCEIQDEKMLLSDGPLPEDGLTLLAVVGMKDPCRPGVTKAVERVQAAGVRVRMVTGDNLATAKAIATECSILSATDMVVDGPTFRQWDDREMREKLPHVTVLARALPSDKLLLVKTLQSMGEVVAVTGDGTNDAPALYQANIGLSMGIEGTEVAKQSSDIIILDDNFASIVRVVQWGRSIYSNIQKFLQFQLTVNMVALVVNFVAAVTSGSVPLTAVQLLWVNLIMDTLGALALATELPANDLMSEAPVCHQEPLLTNTIWRNLAFQATYQVVVLLTLQFHGESLLRLRGNTDSALINRTVIFNTFVLCQIFNLFNARHLHKHNIFHGILHSHLFLGIVAGALIFQVVMVEFLEKFASTMQLDWQHWLVCIGLSSLSWPIAFVVKSIPVPSTPILEKLSWWRNHAINF